METWRRDGTLLPARPLLATVAAIAVTVTTTAAAIAAIATAIAAVAAAVTAGAALRLGFIDYQGTALAFLAIQGVNSGVHGFTGIHGDKSKPSGPSGFAISRHKNLSYFTVSIKQIS